MRHGFLGAHTLQNGLRSNALSQLLDEFHAIIAPFRHDIGRAEFKREVLAGLVTAHRDYSGSTHLFGCKDAQQPDRAVADNDDRRAFSDAGGVGGIPSCAKNVRWRKKTWDEVVGRQVGRRNEGSIGE